MTCGLAAVKPYAGYNARMPPFFGRGRATALPAELFTDLLPQIDDLHELKLTLYVLWRMEQLEGEFRALTEEQIAADEIFLAGLGGAGRLKAALAAAVGRGTLLAEGAYYLLNDDAGVAAADALRAGTWQPGDDGGRTLAQEKPNIYRLYEENIGPLTPLIAEELRAAETDYPAAWLSDAMRIAIKNNIRNWRYVEAILQRWQKEGRDDRTDRGRPEQDRKKYTEGEFSDFVER